MSLTPSPTSLPSNRRSGVPAVWSKVAVVCAVWLLPVVADEARATTASLREVHALAASAAVASPIHLARGGREDSDADRMLEVIRQSLANGDLSTAERQLQILNERHPDSAAAAEGRRMLGKLRDDSDRSHASVPKPPPVLPPRAPVDERAPEPRSNERAQHPASPTSPQSWNTEIRRVRALAQDFKSSVGDRIFFAEASADLGSRARIVLSAQAEWLKRFPQVPVTLVAHSDDRGGKEFNEDISIRRAEAVKARLIAEGVEPDRIRVVPVGREQPVAKCDAAGCAAQNRRVVTHIGDGEAPPPTPPQAPPLRR